MVLCLACSAVLANWYGSGSAAAALGLGLALGFVSRGRTSIKVALLYGYAVAVGSLANLAAFALAVAGAWRAADVLFVAGFGVVAAASAAVLPTVEKEIRGEE